MGNVKFLDFILGVVAAGFALNLIYPMVERSNLSEGMKFGVLVSLYLVLYAIAIMIITAIMKKVETAPATGDTSTTDQNQSDGEAPVDGIGV